MKHQEIEAQGKSGTYAKLVPSSKTTKSIRKIVDQINIENPVSEKDLHVTVVYSREECPTIENVEPDFPIVASGCGFDIFTNSDGTSSLVLLLDSAELQDLHEECVDEHGATHDYDEYKPHITLSYDYTQAKVPNDSLLEYFNNLEFDEYVVEPLDFDWKDTR